MCCSEYSYYGVFQDRANHGVCFVGAGVVGAVLGESFHATVAAVQPS